MRVYATGYALLYILISNQPCFAQEAPSQKLSPEEVESVRDTHVLFPKIISDIKDTSINSSLITAKDFKIDANTSTAIEDYNAQTSLESDKISAIDLDPRYQSAVKAITEGRVKLYSETLTPVPKAKIPFDLKEIKATELRTETLSKANLPDQGGDVLRSLSFDQLPPNLRIFYGVKVTQTADVFPEAVALEGDNGSLCSGVLVSKSLVLTAAHCYCGGSVDRVKFGTDIDHPVDTIDVDKGKSVSYLKCGTIADHIADGDVAVLHLKSPARESFRPIGSTKVIDDAAAIRAIGFGLTNSEKKERDKSKEPSFGKKYQVDIPIVSPHCNAVGFRNVADSKLYGCKPSYELVAGVMGQIAGAMGQRDTCNGDSGSEIISFDEQNNPVVVAITSRGIDPSGSCGKGGVYVLLSSPPIQQWLTQQGVSFDQQGGLSK
jgi:hypothetical protein